MKREYDFSRAKRANFKGLPPLDELPRHIKVRITMMLDYDVLEFFKKRAAATGAEPYQTQINRALREYMAGLGTSRSKTLLDDEGFISSLAERVARYVAKKKPRSKGRRG